MLFSFNDYQMLNAIAVSFNFLKSNFYYGHLFSAAPYRLLLELSIIVLVGLYFSFLIIVTKGLYHRTFYSRYIRIFVIS